MSGGNTGVELAAIRARSVTAPKSKLYAACASLVSLVALAIVMAGSYRDRGESVPGELVLAWVGAAFDSVWVVVVEASRAWHRLRRGSTVLLVLITGLCVLGSAGVGLSGCAPIQYQRVEVVLSGEPAPGRCKVSIWGDGREVETIHGASCLGVTHGK